MTQSLLQERLMPRNNHNVSYNINNVSSIVSKKEYLRGIKAIKKYLEDGLSYQVNYTFKINFSLNGDYTDLYMDLRTLQPTAYSAFIGTEGLNILSLSPELFFRIEGKEITVKPMKGTFKRGKSLKEDLTNYNRLKSDIKIQAENVMIADLLRNDLGRIAGRVWADKLFEIEKHDTLYQMTSTVKALVKTKVSLKETFSSLFPCGSVTGAPKIKTMEIIKRLEKGPRRIYTGAIGYISPKGKCCFNVAIRTIEIKGNRGEMGVGGGIVYDSVGEDEYDEACLKGRFFERAFREQNIIK